MPSDDKDKRIAELEDELKSVRCIARFLLHEIEMVSDKAGNWAKMCQNIAYKNGVESFRQE